MLKKGRSNGYRLAIEMAFFFSGENSVEYFDAGIFRRLFFLVKEKDGELGACFTCAE